MEWSLVYTSNNSVQWMLSEAESELWFKYKRKTGALRLSIEKDRIYFIEKYGLFKKKIDIVSQYNHLTANCIIKNKHGNFKVNNVAFAFQINETILSVITLSPLNSIGEFYINNEYTDCELFAMMFSYIKFKAFHSISTNQPSSGNDLLMLL